MFLRFVAACWFLMILLFAGCNVNPVSDTMPDQIEFESIYQYIKTYSIYQDSSIYENRLPQNPFSFKSPIEMFKSVHDTLKGSDISDMYTGYINADGDVTDSSNIIYSNIASLNIASLSSENQSDIIVTFDTLTNSTVYLKINSFEGNPFEQFSSVIGKAAGFPNIVVDLRENRGGDLGELDSIVEDFLPRGSKYIMIREREYDPATKSGHTLDWHPWITTKYPDPALDKKKISVLMDYWTASASEILASALKDCANAYLIGDRSYGKGMGQTVIYRRHRPVFKITSLQIQGMTPRTGYYHEKGIEPDTIPVDIQTEGKLSFPTNTDRRNLFYAVKMLEPGARAASIKFPLSKSRVLKKTAEGYKVMYDTLNQ